MLSRNNDLTIDQLLNDPVTLAVMQADRVDPDALQAMLRGVAARLHDEHIVSRPAAFAARSLSFLGSPASKGLRSFVGSMAPSDCCRAP